MRSSLRPLLSAIFVLGSVVLTGCAGNMSFPDAPPDLPQTSVGEVHGSLFGGHAPLVGAHIYVIQPGITGYGSQATSILGAPGVVNTGQTDGNVPATWRYITTDSNGAFNLSGAYTCAVGLPVFLYAFGGAPTLSGGSTNTPPTPTFKVTSIAVATSDTPTTLTWTTSAPNLFYVGETITPGGLVDTNGSFSYLNGSTQIVTATPSATTFTTYTTNGPDRRDRYNNAGTYSPLGSTANVVGNPGLNRAAVNMATLGNCPSTGNFASGPSAIQFVYMNEVSTVATAFAFQGFTSSGNNNAFDIGSSGSTGQPLLGLQNAALTAANLYNIQGSDQSTTYAGEGHIARAISAAGNGLIPHSLLDTLGNILAACVDSQYNAATFTASSQCATLFNTATNNGDPTSGTAPFDTATAAFNIARYPAGTGANGGATFVSALFNLPSGVVPFTPNLANQPNDFTVAIRYPLSAKANNGTTVTNSFVGRAESIAIDSKGNVWGTSQGDQASAEAFELTPTGALACSFTSTYIFGYLAIDIQDNPWAGNANSTTGITKLTPAPANTLKCGTVGYNALRYHQAYTVVTDGLGDTYFMSEAQGTTSAPFDIYEFAGASSDPVVSTPTTPAAFLSQPFTNTADVIAHASLDNSAGGFWITNENGATSSFGRVVASTGAALFTLSTSGDGQPEFPAIDSSNNAWIPLQKSTGMVYKVSSSGSSATVKKITNGTSGAEFASSFGAAIDGNGNVWVSNRGALSPTYNAGTAGNNSIVELNSLGVALSPSTNYTLGGILNDPLNMAVDLAGNIWITNYGGDQIVELVGTGAPVVTPFSVASTGGKLGVKP
jgi:hypothetical protein